MLKDLFRTVDQLTDRRLIRVLAISLVLATLLYAGLVSGVGWLLNSVSLFDIGWIDTIIRFLGDLAFALIALLLFPSFAMAIQGLLLEDVAQAVEDRHYPELPEARPQSWTELTLTTLRLVSLAAAVNILLLPVYLALTFLPPLNLVLFYLVNGWLLGREYFETVAQRRMPPAEADAFRKANSRTVWLAGAFITFLFTIPVVNLVAPVVGTAFMLHRFENLRARSGPTGGRNRRVTAAASASVLALLAITAFASSTPLSPLALDLRARAARLSGPENPPDPNELVGLDDGEIKRRLGAPELIRSEGSGRVWQYTSPNCVLDLFLYLESAAFRVVYQKTRARRPDREAGRWCYAGIIAGAHASEAATSARR